MPTLYHYTGHCFLPPILDEGLWRGDVAHPNPHFVQQAVSLTTQTDPERVRCWGTCVNEVAFKLAVRLTCRVPDSDPLLEPARATWKRLGVPRAFVSALDPHGQAKWWSHYHGVIPVDRFEVELRGRRGYVPASGDDLGKVVRAVRAQGLELVTPPDAPYLLLVRTGPRADKALLFDPYPADRFGLVSPD